MTVVQEIMAVLAIVCLLFVGGWKANTIYTGYKNEKVLLQQQVVNDTIRAGQATIAEQFEQQKQGLLDIAKNNKNTTTKIIQNNQPIYSTVCLDSEGIAALQKYKDASNENRGTK